MEKGGTRKTLFTALSILFDSLTFIAIQYILLCCMYSFRAHIVYAFFVALNTSVICKHWEILKSAISNKVLFVTVFVLNFVFLAAFMLMFGYLEISPILKKII